MLLVLRVIVDCLMVEQIKPLLGQANCKSLPMKIRRDPTDNEGQRGWRFTRRENLVVGYSTQLTNIKRPVLVSLM